MNILQIGACISVKFEPIIQDEADNAITIASEKPIFEGAKRDVFRGETNFFL